MRAPGVLLDAAIAPVSHVAARGSGAIPAGTVHDVCTQTYVAYAERAAAIEGASVTAAIA